MLSIHDINKFLVVRLINYGKKLDIYYVVIIYLNTNY